MAQCVVFDGGALVESAADPCTGFVLLTPAEYGAVAVSPFHLTPADGLLVSGAVIGVWAAAVAIRAVVRTLNVADVGGESS